MAHWKVKLYEARPHLESLQPSGVAAKVVDTFGVQGRDHDTAKAAAKKWLEDRKYKIRTISFTTNENELVAYVLPREIQKS